MLIRIEKEDIVRRFTYSEAEEIFADYKKTLPWYNEGLTILACKPLLNKLLLEELHYVKYSIDIVGIGEFGKYSALVYMNKFTDFVLHS